MEANIVMGNAMDCDAPGERNSNLFPVKATGEVLFLSLSKGMMEGSFISPRSIKPLSGSEMSAWFSRFKRSVKAEPR